jgi:hypothetical protein
MCEFCHQHGEGKRWYLQAKNYSEELLSDLKRRQYIFNFIKYPEHSVNGVENLGRLKALPRFVQSIVNPYITNRQKRSYYGQIEDWIVTCVIIIPFLPSISWLHITVLNN